jgi:hypothetical protein
MKPEHKSFFQELKALCEKHEVIFVDKTECSFNDGRRYDVCFEGVRNNDAGKPMDMRVTDNTGDII